MFESRTTIHVTMSEADKRREDADVKMTMHADVKMTMRITSFL